MLDDAKLRLRVETVAAGRVTAQVEQGGPIRPGKGLTFSATHTRQESLSEKDQAIIDRVKPYDFIQFAISYLKDAAAMQRLRARIGMGAHLIAKLERASAMASAAVIAGHADALWVCRGDLGAELGLRAMAVAVSKLSEQVRELPIPVILAGQVLEHMTVSATPTRSEVCYLHDCIQKGYQGFVLSDETALGRYRLEACRTAAMFKEGA